MNISRYLDHAVLKPEMTREEAADAIRLGIDYEVKTVCVRPCDIDQAVEMCAGTKTEVCTVLSFPHGHDCPEAKAAAAKVYCEKGAKEIDMVANYGLIRSAAWDAVQADIEAVVKVAHAVNVLVKVIFETSQLTPEEIAKTTEICVAAGADFVKTSTGFNGRGASEEDVEIMMKTAAGRIKMKPSGGIRDAQRAKMFVDRGVDRLGVGYNSTAAICDGEGNTGEGY